MTDKDNMDMDMHQEMESMQDKPVAADEKSFYEEIGSDQATAAPEAPDTFEKELDQLNESDSSDSSNEKI